MPDIDTITERVRSYDYKPVNRGANTREAAVAVVVRPSLRDDSVSDVLLIQRADREGDRWSGQMAFPGGHLDATDPDLRAAAARETWEEVGLSLDGAEYLGPLDEQGAMARGKHIDMLVAPHVFAMEGDPPLTLNYEVADTVWAPLTPMLLGELHHWQTMDITGSDTVFNGYLVDDAYFVWGLTYRMMKSFFSVIEPAWTPPNER